MRQKLDVVDDLRTKLQAMRNEHEAHVQRLRNEHRDSMDRMRDTFMSELNKRDEMLALVLRRNL
jgi:hypothetical protein